MAQPADNREPSMEELLTRVRRIIAEDDTDQSALRSTEAKLASDSTGPPSTQPSYSVTPVPRREGERAPLPLALRGSLSDSDGAEQLMSIETKTAVHSAFNTLAQTVLLHNSQTLEHMVCEMLRPILKAWLADNLPTVVERLVRAEIERASHVRPVVRPNSR